MKFSEYYEKFEKMQRWIISDLRNSTIKAKANFLVAMGIFNYIEMLGSYYLNDEANYKKFNYVFENLLSNISIRYQEVFDKLKTITEDNEGAYGVLRCGMAHEYFIKTYPVKRKEIEIKYTIYGVDDAAQYADVIGATECGIEIISLEYDKYHIRIYNPRLIHDLNEAFEILKSYIRSNPHYKDKFIERCKQVGIDEFN